MVKEVEGLIHWLRKWSTINNSLIYFSNTSHAMHPFLNIYSSENNNSSYNKMVDLSSPSSHAAENEENSEPAITQTKEKQYYNNNNKEEEKVISSFVEAADIGNISVMYAKVYDMLSTYGKVEYWSNAIILQHLLASSLQAWVKQLCLCTCGVLNVSPMKLNEELVPPQLSWGTEIAEKLWEQALRDNGEPWLEFTQEIRNINAYNENEIYNKVSSSSSSYSMDNNNNNNKSEINFSGEENEKEEDKYILALHSIVNFALHYHRMKWLMKVIFLRVDVEMNDIAWRILKSCVRSTLEYNSEIIQSVLCRIAEECINKLNNESDTLLLLKSPVGLTLSRKLFSKDHILPLISRVLTMLDDCRANKITDFITEKIIQLNQKYGQELALAKLGPLCINSTKENKSNLIEIENTPTLQDASRALDNCLNSFLSLRAFMLLYFGGTKHYIEEVSELGRERVAMAARAFSIGFCEGNILLNFVDNWALLLWLQACEEEHEKRFISHTPASLQSPVITSSSTTIMKTTKGEISSIGFRREKDVETNNNNNNNNNNNEESSIYRSFSEAVSQVGENEGNITNTSPNFFLLGNNININNNNNSCRYRVPPRSGLATLIFFISPDSTILDKFETHFAACVQKHLDSLLKSTQKEEKEVIILRALPREVYQHCIFVLRLTNQFLEPVVSIGSDGAHATLRAVRRGMQGFFLNREPCIILTLASALHMQVNNNNNNNVEGVNEAGGTHLEILDTILELVALLHSKDLFIDCYCGLLAPRLIKMQQLTELDADTEIISRLSVRLGEPLAVEPLALLRDIRISMKDPRCISWLNKISLEEEKELEKEKEKKEYQQDGKVLHQVRVLCFPRWEKYIPVTIKLSEMQKCFETEKWFDEGMLQALSLFEKHYNNFELKNEGEASQHFVYSSNNESIPINNNNNMSSHIIETSISNYLPPVSKPTMQRRQLIWSLGSGSITVICHPTHSINGEVITNFNSSNYNYNSNISSSVQITMPPVGFLILQALERYGDVSNLSEENEKEKNNNNNEKISCCTFEFLHSKLPVNIPKPLLGVVLGALVRNRIVLRTSHTNNNNNNNYITYSLSQTLSGCKRRKIVIETSDVTHHWIPHTQETSSDKVTISTRTVNGIIDMERMKKLEAGIVRVMKSRKYISHAELFYAVCEILHTQFLVTAPMLKQCVAQLMEREFIAREGRDTYVYLA